MLDVFPLMRSNVKKIYYQSFVKTLTINVILTEEEAISFSPRPISERLFRGLSCHLNNREQRTWHDSTLPYDFH